MIFFSIVSNLIFLWILLHYFAYEYMILEFEVMPAYCRMASFLYIVSTTVI